LTPTTGHVPGVGYCILRRLEADLDITGVVEHVLPCVAKLDTKGIRHVPMTSRLAEALRSIRHLHGQLVFCREDGSRLTTTNMRAALKRQEKRAGLPAGAKWHKLRHTFCSHLAMRGAPIVSIKELAGHKSVAVTNRYMHLAPGWTRSAIDLLEARG
jgi:integrase